MGGQVGAVGGELEEGGHEVEERVNGNIARNLVKHGENNQIQDSSSFKPRGRALFPCWDGSQVSHEGI